MGRASGLGMIAALAVLAPGMLAPNLLSQAILSPAWADPSLRGELVAADTHGQAICTTRQALSDYTLATIRQQRLVPTFRNTSCSIAPYGTRVTVLEDLPPFGSRMHMVRVTAATPLQRVEGYTWSVGLYDPRRFAPYSSLGEYFPRIP